MKRTAGDITYELTLKKIKNINMRVGADGTVRVSAPYGTDRDFIDRFVLSRRSFIARAKTRTEQKIPMPEITADNAAVYSRLFDVYQSVYKRFSGCGFPLPQLRVRKMTSQWGNCRRGRGIITLNAYLYNLPEECIAMVAAHELSHMLVPNHSPAFYAVLERAFPQWRRADAMLKRWRLR